MVRTTGRTPVASAPSMDPAPAVEGGQGERGPRPREPPPGRASAPLPRPYCRISCAAAATAGFACDVAVTWQVTPVGVVAGAA